MVKIFIPPGQCSAIATVSAGGLQRVTIFDQISKFTHGPWVGGGEGRREIGRATIHADPKITLRWQIDVFMHGTPDGGKTWHESRYRFAAVNHQEPYIYTWGIVLSEDYRSSDNDWDDALLWLNYPFGHVALDGLDVGALGCEILPREDWPVELTQPFSAFG